MPTATDQHLAALGAGCVGGCAGDVAFIDVMQTGVQCGGAGGVERLGRGAWLIHQFEIGMEGGEVQRDVGTQIFKNPVG